MLSVGMCGTARMEGRDLGPSHTSWCCPLLSPVPTGWFVCVSAAVMELMLREGMFALKQNGCSNNHAACPAVRVHGCDKSAQFGLDGFRKAATACAQSWSSESDVSHPRENLVMDL